MKHWLENFICVHSRLGIKRATVALVAVNSNAFVNVVVWCGCGVGAKEHINGIRSLKYVQSAYLHIVDEKATKLVLIYISMTISKSSCVNIKNIYVISIAWYMNYMCNKQSNAGWLSAPSRESWASAEHCLRVCQLTASIIGFKHKPVLGLCLCCVSMMSYACLYDIIILFICGLRCAE